MRRSLILTATGFRPSNRRLSAGFDRGPLNGAGSQASMHETIPLHLLAPGQSGEISQLLGRPDDVHRLQELGFQSGALVEMVRSGSPCIVQISGQKLCFRETELFQVLVRPGAAR